MFEDSRSLKNRPFKGSYTIPYSEKEGGTLEVTKMLVNFVFENKIVCYQQTWKH
jgi:hypothetical protein